MARSDALVQIDRRGGVATLTLNRPANLNALSSALLAAVQGELDALIADPDLRCVILAAAGKAFCAGHDLGEMRGLSDEAALKALFARCSQVMLSLRRLPVPVIAAVQGAAVAAGCQLVAACDLAIAGRSARFAVSGINLGLFCSTPAVALSRAVPPKAAFDMLVTGRFVDAAEAHALGLVTRIVPDDDLAEAARAYADEIAAKSPAAIRAGKALFYAQREMPLETAYGEAGAVMACNMLGEDAQVELAAFLARRSAA